MGRDEAVAAVALTGVGAARPGRLYSLDLRIIGVRDPDSGRIDLVEDLVLDPVEDGRDAAGRLLDDRSAAPVELTWDSDRALEVITSNFGLDPSQTEGSITDNPGVDTTYRLTIRAQNEGHDPIEITESVTVEVAKSSKSVLVVGDSSVAGANQVLDSLKSLTNGTASISAAVPASTSADVIVLHPSASLSTADRTRIEGLLSAGKAVVFVGGMLGGATSVGNGFDVEFREASGFVPISFRFRGLRLSAPAFTSYSGLQGVGGSADRLITDGGSISSAMAYKVPSGGRTGYVAEDGVGSSSRNQGFDLALRVITRWCMDGV